MCNSLLTLKIISDNGWVSQCKLRWRGDWDGKSENHIDVNLHVISCLCGFYSFLEAGVFFWFFSRNLFQVILDSGETCIPPTSYCCFLITKLCPTLCDPMNCSTPSFPVLHHLPEFAQTHVHWVSDAIQPSHPLSSPPPFALSLSQHQGPFQGVSSLHQVAKVLKLQLQHQSFQWLFRTHFL